MALSRVKLCCSRSRDRGSSLTVQNISLNVNDDWINDILGGSGREESLQTYPHFEPHVSDVIIIAEKTTQEMKQKCL
jgi:hypothetical protein